METKIRAKRRMNPELTFVTQPEGQFQNGCFKGVCQRFCHIKIKGDCMAMISLQLVSAASKWQEISQSRFKFNANI